MLVRVRARARVRVRAPVVQLEAKGLWRVVDDGGLGEVSAEDGQVLEVVAVDQHLEGRMKGGGVGGRGGG